MTGVDRNAVQASYWQFDPDEDDPEVEAMEAAVSFHRNDEDRVLISVRGKPRGRRYESGDSAWIEVTDEEAIKFIKRLAETLGKGAAGV